MKRKKYKWNYIKFLRNLIKVGLVLLAVMLFHIGFVIVGRIYEKEQRQKETNYQEFVNSSQV